jgi:hypothetical protein
MIAAVLALLIGSHPGKGPTAATSAGRYWSRLLEPFIPGEMPILQGRQCISTPQHLIDQPRLKNVSNRATSVMFFSLFTTLASIPGTSFYSVI